MAPEPFADCPPDDLLVGLIERRLPPEELLSIQRHAVHCADCHAAIVALGQEQDGADPTDLHSTESPVPQSFDLWTPPETFSEFRLIRQVGRGGMGVVYLAHDTSLDRNVAVKFIASGKPQTRLLEYFEREARLPARLQHPNVVTVFRVGEVEGRRYIVSEYIVGRSLAELPRPMPWRRALALGIGLARGLAAAHRQGVLHRDIKPSNALVTADNEVKLLDFGLAESFDPGVGAQPSGARSVAGTMLYMAPEVRAGAPATPQSDIYALGLVLYELCAGVVPHLAPTQTRPGAPVDGQPPPDLAGLGPGLDPDFAAIISRCIARDRLERFASADLLCEALERLAGHVPPSLAINPYRGLAPFEAEHRSLFFGRDAEISALLERLRRQQIVLVAADSGIGKSSLCRAGVLPQVAAGALAEGRTFTPLVMLPGRRPLETLAAALAPVLRRPEAELLAALTDTPGWLGQALRETYRLAGGLFLFVDQLEELVTLSDPNQAAGFARLLGELALPAPGVRVLLSVRGDFLTRVGALPGLSDEAERALYLLRPLSPDGVREAIIGPARARGVIFESEELLQHLVESTTHGTGSLPLLQFALAELWERRDVAGGRITRSALEEMGGVAGALSRHADGVIARLDAAQQRVARRLLLHLVTAEGTRIERGEDELGETSEDTRVTLRALVEGRLLHTRTAGDQVHFQIAHDSLIESWALLRNWLDDDIGHRAIRQRIEAASAEWARLERPRELLWERRQLDEVRPLDPSTLGPRDADFLEASRRKVSRRRWLRRFAALLATLTVAATYGSFRLQAYLSDMHFVAARTQEAQRALEQGRALKQQACAGRDEALALYDAPAQPPTDNPPGTSARWDAAEERWAAALRAHDAADAAYTRAEHSLQSALDREYGRAGARGLLADVTYEQLLLEECFHPQGARAEGVRRLQQRFGDAAWQQRVTQPAELEVVTAPPGARVEIERYVDADGMLRLEPIPQLAPLGPTPVAGVRLPAGSYRLHVTLPDRPAVELPLLLARGNHERVGIALPASIPEGFAYVPPGCFLAGSDDPEAMRQGFLRSAPLHRVCMAKGYVIGKTEVTFGDWLKYLDALPPDAPARHLLEQPRLVPAGAVALRREPVGGWVFSFYRSSAPLFTAWEGENFRYAGRARHATGDWRRFPLTGVSSEDLEGYFAWLHRSGRLRGARLCNELEWERAARGADGRAYPHGDRLSPDDADIDVTYGRQPDAFGPDVVGAHPSSASPFGVFDMVGNADEMTRPLTPELGRIVLRGGNWYNDLPSVLIANRMAGEPTQRMTGVGARVCASYPQ